jgi:hypothetical protein
MFEVAHSCLYIHVILCKVYLTMAEIYTHLRSLNDTNKCSARKYGLVTLSPL